MKTGKRSSFSWRRLALLLLFSLLAMLTGAVFLADKVIFQPPSSGLSPESDMTMLEVAPGIKIAVLFAPAVNARYTILYSHGNAESLAEMRPLMNDFRRHGFNAVFYDYEGYGASSGYPSESHCYRDIAAVYNWLVKVMKIKPDRIIIYGRSVGGGPSCYLAAEQPAAGLILESAFLSAFKVVFPWPMPFDRFPNYRRIGKITIPTLIFHGKKDEVIPFSHGETLFRQAGASRKRFVPIPGAMHNDLPETAGEGYWRELEQFSNSLPAPAKITP